MKFAKGLALAACLLSASACTGGGPAAGPAPTGQTSASATSLEQSLLGARRSNSLTIPIGRDEPCELSRTARSGLFVGSGCAALDVTGADRVEGATATLRLVGTPGSLDLSLSRSTSSGTGTWHYRAERVGRCHGGQDWVCPVLWHARGSLPVEAVDVDPQLGTASTRFTLRGSEVVVTWEGTGDLTTSTGPAAGYLLLQQRQSTASGTWGDTGLRSPGAQGQALIYHRFELR